MVKSVATSTLGIFPPTKTNTEAIQHHLPPGPFSRPQTTPEVLRKWKNPQANFKKIFQKPKTQLFKEREIHFYIQQIKD